jgi:hypothetical protein
VPPPRCLLAELCWPCCYLSPGRVFGHVQCPAINAVEMNLQHQLLGCAGADGRLECWDQRQRVLAGELDVVAALAAAGEPASAAAEVGSTKDDDQ